MCRLAALLLLSMPSWNGAVRNGVSLPSFRLTSLVPNAPAITPESSRERVLVLEFWATWCVPCVQQISHLNKVQAELKGRPVDFIAVTSERADTVKRFLALHKMDAVVALDPGDAVSKRLGIEFLPTTLIINQSGVVAAVTQPEKVNAPLLQSVMEGKSLPSSDGASDFSAHVQPTDDTSNDVVMADGHFAARGADLRSILGRLHHMAPERVEVPVPLASRRFTVDITVPSALRNRAQSAVTQVLAVALRIEITRETRPGKMWILRKTEKTASLLAPLPPGDENQRGGNGFIDFHRAALSALAAAIVHETGRGVVDETGIKGLYDVSLEWDAAKPETMLRVLESRYGIRANVETRPTATLVVRESP